MGTGKVQKPPSLQLISRVLKKLILTIFARALTAFTEEQIFRGPYSIDPAEVRYVWMFPSLSGV